MSYETYQKALEDLKKKESALKEQKRAVGNQQKLIQVQKDYDVAVKKAEAEKPWWVRAMLKAGELIDDTVKFGQKIFKATDFDKMEKAVTAAGKAVGLMKNPPEKIVKALDTMGNYLGYINTGMSVKDTVGSFKALITAGQSYSKAKTDTDRINAVASISISTLNTLEKALNIKGGVITTSIASVCNQFLTAMIKSLATACRLLKNNTLKTQLLSELTEGKIDRDENIYTAAVNAYCVELALRMLQDGKTDKEIWEGIEAYKTLKAA